MLTVPGTPTPIVGRQLVAFAFDAARSSTVAFFASWLAFFNGHIGIAKTHHFFFPTLTSFNYKLLTALNVASRAITRQFAGI